LEKLLVDKPKKKLWYSKYMGPTAKGGKEKLEKKRKWMTGRKKGNRPNILLYYYLDTDCSKRG